MMAHAIHGAAGAALSTHLSLYQEQKRISINTCAQSFCLLAFIPLFVYVLYVQCRESLSFCVFVCTQDVQQQRHVVLMHVHGAVRLSRGVHVHRSVSRRRHLSQDGGLPEEPTAV